MINYTDDYLLNKKVQLLQPLEGYRASSDAVLLSAAIARLKPGESVLDVGSGTGAVSLCLACRFPDNQVDGLEIQPQLCELANLSAAQNNFKNLAYYQGDLKNKKLPVPPCFYHHVITNPPFSDHDMPSPNSSKAIAHNHSDINLSGWLKFCLKMLRPFGHLYLINRTEALNEILSFLNGKAGGIKILPVYSKPEQNVKRIIVAAQKDSKAPTVILPPFYMRDLSGNYTQAAQQIFRNGMPFDDLSR